MEKTKLAKIQARIEGVTKEKDNPFFKSKYADINDYIDAIKPILNEEGVVILQPLTHLEGKPALATFLLDAETGKGILESTTPLPDITDPQKMGSAITYFRRYALQSLFVMKAEDDDGNSASAKDATVTGKKAQGEEELPF
jgi:hypothetical protein